LQHLADARAAHAKHLGQRLFRQFAPRQQLMFDNRGHQRLKDGFVFVMQVWRGLQAVYVVHSPLRALLSLSNRIHKNKILHTRFIILAWILQHRLHSHSTGFHSQEQVSCQTVKTRSRVRPLIPVRFTAHVFAMRIWHRRVTRTGAGTTSFHSGCRTFTAWGLCGRRELLYARAGKLAGVALPAGGDLYCAAVRQPGGKPSQMAGVPYAVISRQAFGVFGANIPAVIRGLIAFAWYGIQTYLAANALMLVALKFWPSLSSLTTGAFLGLSHLGWICFAIMWVLQAMVFWHGMSAIKRFIDIAGPAVYVVMLALAGWIVYKTGFDGISFTLASKSLSAGEQTWQMITATALVVSYFSGPLLNFGDFSRYGKSMGRSAAVTAGVCRLTSCCSPSSPW
jgi:hypothetical protein